MKCGARSMVNCFATPHICGLEKGHEGQHACKRILDPDFPMNNPIRKERVCNHRWGRKKTK